MESSETLTRRTFFGAAGAVALTAGAIDPTQAQNRPRLAAIERPTLLYPHPSPTRAKYDLSGIGRFRADPERVGESEGWSKGLSQTRPIPVPPLETGVRPKRKNRGLTPIFSRHENCMACPKEASCHRPH